MRCGIADFGWKDQWRPKLIFLRRGAQLLSFLAFSSVPRCSEIGISKEKMWNLGRQVVSGTLDVSSNQNHSYLTRSTAASPLTPCIVFLIWFHFFFNLWSWMRHDQYSSDKALEPIKTFHQGLSIGWPLFFPSRFSCCVLLALSQTRMKIQLQISWVGQSTTFSQDRFLGRGTSLHCNGMIKAGVNIKLYK